MIMKGESLVNKIFTLVVLKCKLYDCPGPCMAFGCQFQGKMI